MAPNAFLCSNLCGSRTPGPWLRNRSRFVAWEPPELNERLLPKAWRFPMSGSLPASPYHQPAHHRRNRRYGLALLLALLLLGLVGVLLWRSALFSSQPRASSVSAVGSSAGTPAPGHSPSGSSGLPSPYNDGACVVFPPLGANRQATVFVDPGHGGPDDGAN